MSDSLAAIAQGDDYQAMVFWKYANNMLRSDSDIESIGYEYDEVKSFDDVVVIYKRPQSFRTGFVERDYIQVKYHVTQSKLITVDSLVEPQFVNAFTQSFFDKVFREYIKNPEQFCKKRFILYTPWEIDQKDPLYVLIDNKDHSIKINRLFDGTKTNRSAMGIIRKKFQDKMQIDGQAISDTILYNILSQICIYSSSESIRSLKEILNREFSYNGLKTWPDSKITNPYIDMIQAWMKAGKKIISGKDIIEQCKIENLIASQKIEDRIAICSFPSDMEESVKGMLDLTPCFEGRMLKDEYTWRDIERYIEEFVGKNTSRQVKYYIELLVHFSIAFMTGRIMNSKSGIYVMPIQRTVRGVCCWDITDGIGSETAGFIETVENSDISACDTVLMISITHDIEEEVKDYIKEKSMKIYKFYHCKMPVIGFDSVKNGEHAWKLANQINVLIGKRTVQEKRGYLHVFIAGPLAIMFNLGKMSTTYGKVQLYEFDFEQRCYYPTVKYPMKEKS